jgi:heme/copper-type cytochrome/quinol oxidase subunit 1
VLATHARKPVFGYRPMVYAMMAISGLGFIVWGHHMFQSGMNPTLGTAFMAATIMIAVPSAIKTFNWLGTLWGGNIHFNPAMLNAIGFVSMFVIGGLSGIFMASAPIDIPLHDTYFIVAHIHYVLFGGSIFAIFAGIYHWFPKMFGRQLNQRWGVIHFVMTILAFNGTFFLMHILGLGGHPRRYASIMEFPTLEHLQPMNVMMTLSALMLGTAQLPFLYNFMVSLPRKLGRAIVALFTVLAGLPYVMGVLYHSAWAQPLRTTYNIFQSEFWQSDDPVKFVKVWGVMGAAGAVFAVVVTLIVFALWAVGGKLRMPALLQRAMYVVFLPAFLAPLLLKPDAYLWLGLTSGYEARWLLLALTAAPGLVYLLAARPRDAFGYVVGDNPWHANSLEWATTSPPPHDNFAKIPTVHRGPYEYSSPVVEEDFLPQPRLLPAGVVEPMH